MTEVCPVPVSVIVPSPDTRVLPRPVCVRVSMCFPRAVWSSCIHVRSGRSAFRNEAEGPFPSRNLIRKLRTLANSHSLHPTPRKKREDGGPAFGLCCVFCSF